jgi:hypothetical protein
MTVQTLIPKHTLRWFRPHDGKTVIVSPNKWSWMACIVPPIWAIINGSWMVLILILMMAKALNIISVSIIAQYGATPGLMLAMLGLKATAMGLTWGRYANDARAIEMRYRGFVGFSMMECKS